MRILGIPLPKKVPVWVGIAIGVVVLATLFFGNGGAQAMAQCPGSQVYCPGVGCISGQDKCFPGNVGGPSAVFSKEGFTAQCKSMTACPDGSRTDGPCLMEFPAF